MVGSRAILLSVALAPVPSHAPPAWQWPLRPPPRVVRGFSPPAHPWEAGHRGVDLAARPGRPVYAAGPGRVGFAGDLAGRGVVTIVHGALRTTYLPVRPAVRAGQSVRAGDRIGVVAATPGHCGGRTCLHWGLLRGFTYLDPLGLLGLGPVRLLPWWPAAPPGTDPAGPATPYGGPPGTDPTVPATPYGGLHGPPPAAPGATVPGATVPGAAWPDATRPDAAWPDAAPPTGLDRAPRAGTRPPGPSAGAARTTPTRLTAARHGGRATDHRRAPDRTLAARLADAATAAGAGLAGGLIALGVLGVLGAARPSKSGARLRRRISRP